MSERCDFEVYKHGTALLLLDGWQRDVEPWVQRVAKESGERVDWHYVGGRAVVLVLGDERAHARAMAAASTLLPELPVGEDPDRPVRLLRRYEWRGR